jgi:hypothetical protein
MSEIEVENQILHEELKKAKIQYWNLEKKQ